MVSVHSVVRECGFWVVGKTRIRYICKVLIAPCEVLKINFVLTHNSISHYYTIFSPTILVITSTHGVYHSEVGKKEDIFGAKREAEAFN